MESKRREVAAIADSSAAPDFTNTIVALVKTGQLLDRAGAAFDMATSANTNPALQKLEEIEAPKFAALEDSITLNVKLFERVKAVYAQRNALHMDSESRRLLEVCYQRFTHAGANLAEADKVRLKEINSQLSVLANVFDRKLLAAFKEGAFQTTDKSLLAGMSDGQIEAARLAAKNRNLPGYLLSLQNTTQQPLLGLLSTRETRASLYNDSWNRAERGGDTDTRETISHIAQLRAERAKLLGYPNYAAWKLDDQMAQTPAAVLKFMDELVPAATAKAAGEAKDIQEIMNKQASGVTLAPYDWEFYAEQVRKAKYDLNEAEVRPYFELNRVLQDGVFYAATKLYGITFKERKDIPVYHPEVRVFEVTDADGKPLALFYGDFYARDNKQGGAWTGGFGSPSKLTGTMPVVYNVENLPKPAPGEPSLISADDVRTMFHEFGHALHAMFASVQYPVQNLPRDFVEFPSQFNEHWASDPDVFAHYARHYKTGAVMPPELLAKLQRSRTFNQGYLLTEMLAAAELDMQWHMLSPDAKIQQPDTFEQSALEKTKLALAAVPPRYRSSYFEHIWSGGYAAGYYGYLWSEMLDDDAYSWFMEHGGPTRANGDRFRQMVLSRGDSQDFETMYENWRGGPPRIDGMLKQRGLTPE